MKITTTIKSVNGKAFRWTSSTFTDLGKELSQVNLSKGDTIEFVLKDSRLPLYIDDVTPAKSKEEAYKILKKLEQYRDMTVTENKEEVLEVRSDL